MTDKGLIALALALGLSGSALTAAAQDRSGQPATEGAVVRPCPAASARSAARGMTAQTAPRTTATSGGSAAGSRSWWMMGGAGRNPVGPPGMYTGVDTGVTRGPALNASATTGLFGAGSLSSSVVSGQATGGHGTSSASTPTATASADPC